ncbi:phage baseplate protein [Anaerotruncus colihominis]|uniref:phage baseplate protein n=1 Tax=Anaerotruncus colihominis TaxID=169435 RepID=UPI002943B65E|nr:hypothetical protein [Anaerotruncus colihominis]
MARAKQPVSVNGIEFDALISQTDTLEATVPEYTVEDGFVVSDAIILNPEKLDMVLYITDTPVTWYSRHGSGQDRVETIVKQLQELYFTAEPTTVVTSAKSYTNMAIESLSIAKSLEIGYAREISISFKKIRVTTAKTTTIPDSYGKSGTTQASTGMASTSSGSSGGSSGSGSGSSGGSSGSGSNSGSSGGSKSSILYSAANSIGLI